MFQLLLPSIKYPPNAYLFDVWECYGKFDSKLIGKSYLPLCVPTKDEFKVNFKIEDSYEQFLRKFKLKAPQSDKPNPLIPSMFIFPFSEEEFEMKNFSGDYRTIASMFNPGELVTHITKGPIFKPAKLFSLESDGRAKIEYSEFDGDKSTKIVSTTVGYNEYAPLQRAGPNFGIHEKVPIPQSMVD